MGESEATRSCRLADLRLDGGTQPRVVIDEATVAEYAEALIAGATFPPLVVFFDGVTHWLADGFHRVHAARRAGLDELDMDLRFGERRAAVLFAAGANARHGLRRTNADKRRAVELLLGDLEWQQWSDREIARRCGVVHEFVRSVRKELSGYDSQIETTRKVERGGTTYEMDTASINADRPIPVAEVFKEAKAKLGVHFSSETPEHYSPTIIIEAARDVLERIDLDPCSNSATDPHVPAAEHYTRDDDGLAHEWVGTVYMNPPYGREIGAWVEKLVAEHKAGRVPAAIALVPARPDTAWWHLLRDYVCCFIEGRLTFVGNDDPAPFPSAVFYLGEDLGAFYHAFSGLGDVWQRLEPGLFGE